jgi:hypothetical protein
MKINLFFKSTFLLACILLVFSSCSDSSVDNPQGAYVNLAPENGLSFNVISDSYEAKDVMGLIYLKSNFKEIFLPGHQDNSIDEDSYQAQAYFYNPNNPYEFYKCDGIEVNDILFVEAVAGHLVYVTAGDNSDNSGMQLNFGTGTNDIEITGNENIPAVDTSISFIAPVRFTNIERGDTISTSESLILNWSGTSNDYVQIYIINTSVLFEEYPPTKCYEGSAIVHNNGSLSIPANLMGKFPEGVYDIDITRYELKFIELSNGYRIAVIAKPKHIITVFFVD